MSRAASACLFTILLASACDPTFDESSDVARLEEMEQEILALVADPLCEASNDCRFVGVGAKPCGGPWYYLVYSVASVDSAALAAEVAEYNEFNAELNGRYGWVSDCSVPPVPTPGCQDGTCVDLDAR
jgi:hypothetical protein